MRVASFLAGTAAALTATTTTFAGVAAAAAGAAASRPDLNVTRPLASYEILPPTFRPPQVFRNVNLLRSVNLEKGYVREQISVVVENTDKKAAHAEYFVPFEAALFGKIGGFVATEKPKKDGGDKTAKIPLRADVVEFDATSPTQFIRVTLPEPLKPKAQLTLAIAYNVLSSLQPLPAAIEQQAKQYLQFSFSPYAPSAYPTANQKTKIKFPSVDIPDYTGKPERQGSTFTYGPFTDIPAGEQGVASVRYEFTKPVMYVTRLERDVEVSHWGGNVAFEERYWLTNRGAHLAKQYNRVEWQQTTYARQYGQFLATPAIAEINVPLAPGSLNPYFTDEVGNVSTSKFRSGRLESMLELKPRYPVFGGWNFPFKIGWDADAKWFLRKLQGGAAAGGYVLQVPFLEGPKMSEGISYERINLRVILPEGATNVKFETDIPLAADGETLHRTFMDTLGRTSLELTAVNVADDVRGRVLTVTYDYSTAAMLRKPLTIVAGVFAVFVASWLFGQLDVTIGRKA